MRRAIDLRGEGDVELTQRSLVNRRVRLTDGDVLTKYVFPFWDREWNVALTLLDRFGSPPSILHLPASVEQDHVRIPARLRDQEPVERWKPEQLRHLFHYDPWWVFRGIGGVPDSVKRAVHPTNISKPFTLHKHHWKVHDVAFDPGGRVNAIVAKNEVFLRRDFTAADLDLEATWPKVATPKG